nr:uncharacterized protein LOC111858518 [Paramormyrops kingsleyae]
MAPLTDAHVLAEVRENLRQLVERVTERRLQPLAYSKATPPQPTCLSRKKKKKTREQRQEEEPAIFLRACSLSTAALSAGFREDELPIRIPAGLAQDVTAASLPPAPPVLPVPPDSPVPPAGHELAVSAVATPEALRPRSPRCLLLRLRHLLRPRLRLQLRPRSRHRLCPRHHPLLLPLCPVALPAAADVTPAAPPTAADEESALDQPFPALSVPEEELKWDPSGIYLLDPKDSGEVGDIEFKWSMFRAYIVVVADWSSGQAADSYRQAKWNAALAVAEAKTWAWEEFGEAIENDFWMA